jgi:uncharacterized glyoxalase superfamily protein PhnB
MMRLIQARIVTQDVARLAGFYSDLLATPAILNDYYVEIPTGALTIAFSKDRFTEYCGGGDSATRPGTGVVLDFQVDDVDTLFPLLDGMGVPWVMRPTTQPWGTRAMVFRDPEGHPVNVFSRLEEPSCNAPR